MSDLVVSVRDLRFRWGPKRPLALDLAGFEVAARERVFVHGPSGSGKTTLLNLLGGVAQPESGRVEVLGVDLAKASGRARDRFRAARVGLIFQMFNLAPFLSMIDNVLLPCRFSKARRMAALANGGTLGEEARRLLVRMGLDVDGIAGRPVAELSVGQQQRVAAARALIGAPGLIIADEPTSALDPASRDAFLDLLFQETSAAGGAILFVSHDAALARQFDRSIDLAALNRAAA